MGSYKNVDEIYRELKQKASELETATRIEGFEENTEDTIVEQRIEIYFENSVTENIELELRRVLQGEGWDITVNEQNVQVVKTLDLGDVLPMYDICFVEKDSV